MNKGKLKINSDNIFPIIKKWLYSDSDIFIRELVSNATDAISKVKKLEIIGEAELEEGEKFKIDVFVDPDEKTIKFIDNGIGMSFDEVDKFINEIAFSGAEAFVEKYKGKTNDDMIIGHFGLGFYSAFMVADKVTIETKSYNPEAPAVYWECDGSDEYNMQESSKENRGTEITLFLNDESYEFCNDYRVREVLTKYCSFMPYEIYLSKKGEEVQYEEVETEEKDAEGNAIKEKVVKEPVAINNSTPLWAKTPSECTDEEYLEFYRNVFHDYKAPLFWIHLNMDYPFNLKGILYFPKLSNKYESAEGRIKLYNNQVFIADNIKEVIPEFLLLLRGTIDCPDLPLNVSRSALQNDGFVKKVSDYITKKVADKLSGMCKVEREAYESYWDDIAPFIKYGCLKDDKFESKIMPSVLFKDINDKYQTMVELGFEENNNEDDKEKDKDIYYVTDIKKQASYIDMFRKEGLNAVILPDDIDSPFINSLEYKHKGLHFKRIDSGLDDIMKEESQENFEEIEKALSEILKKVAVEKEIAIKLEALKDSDVSSMLIVSEESRRMSEMMKMYSPDMELPNMAEGATLVLNRNNVLVKYLISENGAIKDNSEIILAQLYDLARLSNASLEAEDMSVFVRRTNMILDKLIS